MIELAYRLVSPADVEPGSMVATTQGRMAVTHVIKTAEGITVQGAPERPGTGRIPARLQVIYGPEEQAVVVADPGQLDVIEGVVVSAMAMGEEADEGVVVVTDHTWILPRRGAPTPLPEMVKPAKRVREKPPEEARKAAKRVAKAGGRRAAKRARKRAT